MIVDRKIRRSRRRLDHCANLLHRAQTWSEGSEFVGAVRHHSRYRSRILTTPLRSQSSETGALVHGPMAPSTYPALEVINQVQPWTPDYTIHLGDVYYAGTAGFLDSDEEVSKLRRPLAERISRLIHAQLESRDVQRRAGLFCKGLKASPFSLQTEHQLLRHSE